MESHISPVFLSLSEEAWTDTDPGVCRQVMGYDASVMLVKVRFKTGAEGNKHRHPHAQTTCVVSGRFLAEIGEEQRELVAGDGFYVPPGTLHGVKCLEAGMLLDAFSPMREDFI